jgi:hypothetical protein
MNPKNANPDRARYDQIEGEAFERYLLQVIERWAAEEARLGVTGFSVFKDARFIGGEYPHTEIEIESVSAYDPGRSFTSRYPIDEVRERADAKRVAAQVLEELFD